MPLSIPPRRPLLGASRTRRRPRRPAPRPRHIPCLSSVDRHQSPGRATWGRPRLPPRQQRRIDHRRADAEQRARDEPRHEALHERNPSERDPLYDHAAGDQPLPSPAVAHRARPELTDSPRCRVRRRKNADLAYREARAREQEREESPREPVVQVVRALPDSR